MPEHRTAAKVVLLAGGVGGARMASGLAAVLPASHLTVIVNVGDDDDFHGLRVCPDLDTVLYTLSGRIDRAKGWGVAADTTQALDTLKRLGAADTWMTLGDADLGLHIHRSQRLSRGQALSRVTAEVARAFGIAVRVLPASDDAIATRVSTAEGTLRFQQWFVQRRCATPVTGLAYAGAETARAAPGVEQALTEANVIVFAPSNPLLSIRPMLAIPALAQALRASGAAKIVVSPLIGGKAVKGPLDRLLRDLGHPPGNAAIADFYAGWADLAVIDSGDAQDLAVFAAQGLQAFTAPTLMRTAQDGAHLAGRVLHHAREHSAPEVCP